MQLKKPISPWTQDDLALHKQLDELLSKNAKWETSTADAVRLYRCLVWFAQLKDKIEGSAAEITRVINPKEEKEAAEKRSKSKKESNGDK